MATPSIDLIALLKKTIHCARMDSTAPVEEIIQYVLTKIELAVPAPAPVATVVAAPSRSRSTGRSSTATGEKRTIRAPDDDIRCMARTLDESIHSESGTRGGRLKVMRDDPANLYGDRCKFKKTGESNFCKHHLHKQPLGVWGGEYSDRFALAVEKTESDTEAKKKTSSSEASSTGPKKLAKAPEKPVVSKPVEKAKPAPAPVKKAPSPPPKDSDTEEDEDMQALSAISRKSVVPSGKPKELSIDDLEETETQQETHKESEEEDPVETTACEIEGQSYQRDDDGNIYDEDGNAVGVYSFEKNKWTKKYSN